MYNTLTKEQQLIILGLILSIVVGLGVTAYRHFFAKPANKITIEEPKGISQLTQRTEIFVHLAGAVKKEGVYKLKAGDRLIDALGLAGGAEERAELSSVNLAEVVKDGERIIIPVKPKVGEGISGNPDIRRSGTLLRNVRAVNINTAGEKEIDSLPGIGPSLAKAIIEYRTKNGSFPKIEQLLKVSGIGKGKFEKIKDKITI